MSATCDRCSSSGVQALANKGLSQCTGCKEVLCTQQTCWPLWERACKNCKTLCPNCKPNRCQNCHTGSGCHQCTELCNGCGKRFCRSRCGEDVEMICDVCKYLACQECSTHHSRGLCFCDESDKDEDDRSIREDPIDMADSVPGTSKPRKHDATLLPSNHSPRASPSSSSSSSAPLLRQRSMGNINQNGSSSSKTPTVAPSVADMLSKLPKSKGAISGLLGKQLQRDPEFLTPGGLRRAGALLLSKLLFAAGIAFFLTYWIKEIFIEKEPGM